MFMLHKVHMRQSVALLSVVMLFLLGTGVSSAAKTKLSLLHAWTGFREPMVKQMLDEFTKTYPDIEVESRMVSTTAIQQQFTVAWAGGVAPDVVMITTKNLVDMADQGVFLPLDEFMKRDGITKDIWFPSELAQGQLNDKTYGLPIRTGGEAGNVLYYNKQLFSEAGLNPQKAPATWKELLAYSKKLIRYNGDKIMLNPINDITQGATIQPALNWLYAGGGQFLSDDLRTVQFASKQAVDTLDWVHQFRSEVYRNVGDDNMSNDDFYSGRSAMFFWGSEGFSFVWDQNPDFPLGAGPRPKQEGSQYIGVNQGTWSYAIPATVANKEAAWQLLKWLTIRQESAGWFIRAQGRPSPIVKYNRHPDYLKINPLMPVLGQVLDQVAQMRILPIHDDLGIPFRDAFRQVVKGEAAAQAALQDAASRAQTILDEYWKKRSK